MAELSRLCIHTITTKPWGIEKAVERYAAAGVKGITVWRDTLQGHDPAQVGEMIHGAGMEVVSLCRGGFFPGLTSKARQAAIEDNRKALDEAAALGAPLVVLVPGADPGQGLAQSRKQIMEGIEAVLPQAEANGVKLGIEALHPMLADNRSAVNTLKQANDMCGMLDSPWVGVVVDVYHLWWDPNLAFEIARSGANGTLLAYHVSDWRTPTQDLVFDRGVMGEGCIPLKEIGGWVDATDFNGFIEVEIFSNLNWQEDQDAFLNRVVQAYQTHC